ncbi:hypothetical protein KPSA1_03447 [Pseudomonas syringae pv. actinidiae]|uniref:Uncharacterized protein n=1 Tax=Pseudomonas syringae pv. actinidiae TaxID=103796 RepID=A0A2V0QHG8_PSESF|nr:hypothetical protein KPSA1_03447 [Pseudomonas syringae pv. actinidiae]
MLPDRTNWLFSGKKRRRSRSQRGLSNMAIPDMFQLVTLGRYVQGIAQCAHLPVRCYEKLY